MEQLRATEIDGVSKKDFINSVAANNIVKVSQLHIMYVTFVLFREKIEEK